MISKPAYAGKIDFFDKLRHSSFDKCLILCWLLVSFMLVAARDLPVSKQMHNATNRINKRFESSRKG